MLLYLFTLVQAILKIKNSMVIKTTLYRALKLKYEAQEAEARANLEVYFNNSAGVGEHPDIIEAMDQQVDKLAQAQDKLEALEKEFG